MEKIPRRKKMGKATQEPIRALFVTRKKIQNPNRMRRGIHPRERRGRSKWPI
jgi:hypothetical protein